MGRRKDSSVSCCYHNTSWPSSDCKIDSNCCVTPNYGDWRHKPRRGRKTPVRVPGMSGGLCRPQGSAVWSLALCRLCAATHARFQDRMSAVWSGSWRQQDQTWFPPAAVPRCADGETEERRTRLQYRRRLLYVFLFEFCTTAILVTLHKRLSPRQSSI